MSRYLRKGQWCSIHRSTTCEPCHRPQAPRRHSGPITTFADGREKVSPAILRERKHRAVILQRNYCWWCGEKIHSFLDADIHHLSGRKMGGGSRDDRQENLRAVHRACHDAIHRGETRPIPYFPPPISEAIQ